MKRRHWGCALLAGVLLAGLVTLSAPLFGAITPYSTIDEESQLATGAERWRDARLRHYRLTAEINGFQPCTFTAEVQNEQIIGTPDIQPAGCSQSTVQTMSGLYERAESFARNSSGRCGANGCACDGPLGLRVQTDDATGALRQFAVRPRPDQAWRYRSIWNTLTGRQVCTLIDAEYPAIRVLRLEPLP